MSPARLASRIHTNKVRAGLRDFWRRCQYIEKHDPSVVKINRLWKPLEKS